MNKTILLKYLFWSQVIVAALIGIFLSSGGTLEGLQVVWSNQELILGLLLLEVYAALAIFLVVKEQKNIADEREQLIELKAYRATYRVLMLSAGFFLAYNVVLNKDPKPIIPLVLATSFLQIFNYLAVLFYRKTN